MFTNLIQTLYKQAYLLLALTALFWAGNFVIGRGVHETIPPLGISFWRWFLAALIITPFAWANIKQDWAVIKQNIWFLLLLGLLSGAGFNALTYLGLHTTTATNALVLNSSMAMMIIMVNFTLFGIKLNGQQTLALLISFIGVMLIIAKGDLATIIGLKFNQGDLLIFAAILGWAIYTALLPKRPAMHWLSFTASIFWAAAIILTPLAIVEHFSYAKVPFDAPTLLTISYVTIFPGLLAYIFYNRAVDLIGGNKAGIAIYLMPLFGTLLSMIFLSEQPEYYHLFGFLLIITGIAISSRDKAKQPQK